MGAGIPLAIPAVIESLCTGNPVDLPLRVEGTDSTDSYHMHFDPRPFLGARTSQLVRPRFLPIVASATLATMLVRKARGRIDGFIVEGPTAGGHNAPPRGALRLNPSGEPIYGDRDVVDLDEMRSLDRPFWLAGSYGTPERVVQAMEAGAAGVQVGTAFAFCRESGLRDDIKRKVIRASVEGQLEVFTDPVASPTGFPFKVLQLEETLSRSSIYESRQRHCDLGYLRQAYKRADGSIGWRCPAEPVDAYVSKGGRLEHTAGRKCLCNALVANIGLEQLRRAGGPELPLLTCGDCVNEIRRFLPEPNAQIYSAKDVVSRLTSAIGGEEKRGALACRQL
jgi:nitronate monooxygenase